MVATGVTNFFLSVFFSEKLGFSGRQIGVLFAAQALTGVLASFPTGLGNDRITSRTFIGAGLVFQAIGFALMGWVRMFVPYLLIFFFWSLSNNVFKSSLDVQILKTDTGERTGSRIGFYQAWRYGGLAVGTIGAGYILHLLDFQKSLFTVAALCLALSWMSRGLAPTPVTRVRLSDYFADFSSPRAILFAGWLFLFATHWGAEYTCYGLFLRKGLHLSLQQMGLYMSAEFAAVLVTLLLVRNRTNGKRRLRNVAIAGLVASGAGHIGMVLRPVALSLAFRSLHGLGDGLMVLVMYIGLARLFSIERLGGNAGLVNLSTMLGFVTGSLIYGPMGEHLGYSVPFWISGALTILLALPIVTDHPVQWARALEAKLVPARVRSKAA